jgi:hypothetical protein
MDEKYSPADFSGTFMRCAVTLKHVLGYEEWAKMGSFGFLPVDPCAATTLAEAKPCGIFPLICDDEQHVLTIGMTEIETWAVVPVEVVSPCNFWQLRS